jgi:hypothetical protein
LDFLALSVSLSSSFSSIIPSLPHPFTFISLWLNLARSDIFSFHHSFLHHPSSLPHTAKLSQLQNWLGLFGPTGIPSSIILTLISAVASLLLSHFFLHPLFTLSSVCLALPPNFHRYNNRVGLFGSTGISSSSFIPFYLLPSAPTQAILFDHVFSILAP